MSDEIPKVAFPKASATLGSLGSVDPISITITSAVNEFPSATVEFQPKQVTGAAKSVLPSELTGIVAAAQASIFKAAEDASIKAEDGLGGSISFNGFLSNFSYSVYVGNVGYQATVVHKSAILDVLKTSIYYTGRVPWRTYAESPKGDTKYGSWMSNVLSKTIEKWEEEKASMEQHTVAIQERQHTNNEKALALWYKLLGNSTANNLNLSKMVDEPQFRESMTTSVVSVYSSSFGRFMQTIQQFCMQFQLLYVPSLHDDVGNLVNIRDVLKNGASKDALIQSMQHSSGVKRVIPITQVLVKGLPDSFWRDGVPQDVKNGALAHLSIVPNNVNSGGVYEVTAPSWIPTTLYPIQDTPDTPEATPAAGPPNLEAYESSRRIVNENYRKTISPSIRAVMDEWGKDVYVDVALADSTVNLVVALDFSWETGKTYTVAAKATGATAATILFEGFLFSLSHKLSSNEMAPQASTTLYFTHVRGVGFRLPGI